MALLLQRRSVEFDPPPRHQFSGLYHSAETAQAVEPSDWWKWTCLLSRTQRVRASPGPPVFEEHLMSIHRLVLVLNASYEPIHICTARRAITMVLKGAAVVEECSIYTIRTSRIDVPVPSVIRLRQYRRMPRVQRAVSRRGILLRDSGACQYCGARLPSKDLTLDHVVPRSRSGASTWENLVACCMPCNNRKGN